MTGRGRRIAVMVLAGTVAFLSFAGLARRAEAVPPGIQWTELERRFEGVFVLSASREVRKVALTFDDVPDPRFTGQVLDVLKKKRVKATFFAMGTRSQKHPDLLRRIQREGHDVGNHSYSHPDFSKLPLDKVKSQITRAETVISGIIGYRPKLVRPPYGEIMPEQLEWAKAQGYTVVNWDVDSADWRQLTADEVFRNVTKAVRPGSVILMHAGGGEGQSLAGTVKALPRIIDWLREHHYEPVALTELLGIPAERTNEGSLKQMLNLPPGASE
ncbi:polysaccharide deacetylase family protein [Cohnella sp. GCM10027633]|uniref:polysaccharide deacetylase family protein n=1 Tax=unclassified Cohnella TaxID=2636738 RepID=UPI0036290634